MKLITRIAILCGVVWTGCAVEPGEPPAVAAQTSALTCAPYDPSYCDPATSCDLGPSDYHDGQYVACGDQMIMFAYGTPDCRWCIPRDVCIGHGGPLVCPF